MSDGLSKSDIRQLIDEHDDSYLGVTTHQFYSVQALVLRQLVRAFRHRRHRDQEDDRSDRE